MPSDGPFHSRLFGSPQTEITPPDRREICTPRSGPDGTPAIPFSPRGILIEYPSAGLRYAPLTCLSSAVTTSVDNVRHSRQKIIAFTMTTSFTSLACPESNLLDLCPHYTADGG